VTGAQATAAGTAVVFAVCAALLAWLGSVAGTLFALGCTVTVGGLAIRRA
jgi:hypothetical protein